jgi:hypothetical protein
MTQQPAADSDISGWYLKDNESQPQRVRAAIEAGSLSMRTLTGAEIARWSLDQLENVSIPVMDRDWVIRDRRVADPALLLENDQDYAAVQSHASDLAPVSARTVRQVSFAAHHGGGAVIHPYRSGYRHHGALAAVLAPPRLRGSRATKPGAAGLWLW